jgi:hypothetical protein
VPVPCALTLLRPCGNGAFPPKGHSDKLIQFLEKANADAVVIASAPSVLAKDPSERAGFDLQVLSCLRDFLREKLAALDAEIQAETADQAGNLRPLGN